MNDELTTCDTILSWLKERIEHREPIDPHLYLDAATKLNILSSDETDFLLDLKQIVAVKRMEIIEAGKSATHARMALEATNDYKVMKKQEAKVERIEEAIRLGKLAARLKNDELKRTI